MMDFRNYYRVLGVPRTASADDIRLGFRRAARRYHPDVNPDADAAVRMAEVNEAYAVLSDAGKRRVFDRFGARHGVLRDIPAPAGPRPAVRTGVTAVASDRVAVSRARAFVTSLIGRLRPQPDLPVRGEDRKVRVEITVVEAFQGTRRKFARAAAGAVSVRIPKGVRHGQRFRVAGQGLPGRAGAGPGDLILELAVVAPTVDADMAQRVYTLMAREMAVDPRQPSTAAASPGRDRLDSRRCRIPPAPVTMTAPIPR